jgi:hypothetical protein
MGAEIDRSICGYSVAAGHLQPSKPAWLTDGAHRAGDSTANGGGDPGVQVLIGLNPRPVEQRRGHPSQRDHVDALRHASSIPEPCNDQRSLATTQQRRDGTLRAKQRFIQLDCSVTDPALSCARRLAAIKCSADRAQLDTVSYPLPIGVGCQSWSVQPSRQC